MSVAEFKAQLGGSCSYFIENFGANTGRPSTPFQNSWIRPCMLYQRVTNDNINDNKFNNHKDGLLLELALGLRFNLQRACAMAASLGTDRRTDARISALYCCA